MFFFSTLGIHIFLSILVKKRLFSYIFFKIPDEATETW